MDGKGYATGIRLVVLGGLVCLMALVGAASAGAATGAPEETDVLPGTASVILCHATGNSFVQVEANVSSIVNKQGHGTHVNDIIPPFSYRLTDGPEGRYPGRNWDEAGEAIWANGCSRLPPPAPNAIEVFACVDLHAGGFDATFGYNSSGEATIPVGPENNFSPPPADREQEIHFRKGEVLAAFTVRNITESQLTWTVTHDGRTDSVTVDRASPPCGSPEEPSEPEPPAPPPAPEPAVPIGVFVDCVTDHGSTYDAVFGYDSENPDVHTIPVGDANLFSPGPANRGQPTTFRPGHHGEAVKVTGIPSSVALRWTLALTDTRSAIATADFGVKCARPTPSPQPLGIFATCATRHGSTYDAIFGYVNENPRSLAIPIGPRNSISPGDAGQGQPETFEPGFVDSAFVVRDIPISRSLTWSLELDHGGTRTATADADLPPCLTTPIGPVSTAAVGKSASPRRAVVGQRVRFTIALRNDGSEVLRPAEVEDVLRGARLRIISAEATRGQCLVDAAADARTLRCTAPTLAPGASMTVRVVAKAIEVGTARDRVAVIDVRGSQPATAAVRVEPPTQPPSAGLG